MFKTLEEWGLDMPPAALTVSREMVAKITERKLRVSVGGSWYDSDTGTVCVSSVETMGPGTYNSPVMCLTASVPVADREASKNQEN